MNLRRFSKLIKPDVGRSNERSREKWLRGTLARLPAGGRILDAGAGTQRYRAFCGHLKYVSQDFGEYTGEGDGTGLQKGNFDYGKLDIVSDISAIPEPQHSFDAIMCIEVLEHLPSPIDAIKEFSRLLRPGGQLIITAPFCSLTHFAPYHFVTGFNRYWYEHHLVSHGLKLQEISPNGNFFEYLAQELYRTPSTSREYAGIKPGVIESFALLIVQRMLKRFSKKDAKSSELLCFGYHVRAEKL